jgi:aminoglycoside phosphotransferase (APT) family kinase protein
VGLAPARGCLVYGWVPGRPLATLDEPARVPETTTATLAGFLADLHEIPTAPLRAAGLADEDTPPAEWLAEARHQHARVAELVPAPHRAAVAAFLAAPAPLWAAPAPVLLHNDLGAEHVLVDPATRAVTGIIDWADAAIGDPAYDHAKLLRDLGPAAPGPPDPATGQRALFLARCSVFEDLAYGMDTGRRTYLDNARAAVVRLFPAQGADSASVGDSRAARTAG